ncbi:MAG: nuclear transport factor 2 family protein [Pseudomonadales bacterium]
MTAAAKLAIHELLGRSALALDERNVAALKDTFSKKATLTILIGDGEHRTKADPITFAGREAVMDLMSGSMEDQKDLRRHVITNVIFDSMSKKEARVTSYLQIYSIENGTVRCVSTGLYRDRVVRKKRGWQIASRLIDLDLPY